MALKGWSFGALTDALGSAAFVNASLNPVNGEIPIVDNSFNMVLPYGAGIKASNGLVIKGPSPDYNAFFGQLQNADGSYPSNDISSSVNFKAGTDNTAFGIIRGTGPVALGFAIKFNDLFTIKWMKQANRLTVGGGVYATRYDLGNVAASSVDLGTTKGYLMYESGGISLGSSGAQWQYTNNGMIYLNGQLYGTDSDGMLKGKTQGGSWEQWNAVPAGLQVDMNKDQAHTIVRGTVWGTAHVVALVGAHTSGRPVARLHAGTNYFTLTEEASDNTFTLSRGGMYAPGSIVAGSFIKAGNGGSTMHQDGNIEGPLWGGYLSNWINNNLSNVWNGINARITQVRLSGRNIIGDTGGRMDLPSGAVYTGMSGANYDPRIWGAWSQIQYLVNGQWINVGGN